MRHAIVYLNKEHAGSLAMLAHIHERLVQEKLLYRLFYDGANRTLDNFMADMVRPGTLPFVVMAGDEPAAFTWLNSFEGRSARGHFVFFRHFWGRKCSVDIGRRYFRYALSLHDSEGYLLDSLVGITPKQNALSWKYALECGCVMVGTIPQFVWMADAGVSEDAIAVVATREGLGLQDGEQVEAVWDA